MSVNSIVTTSDGNSVIPAASRLRLPGTTALVMTSLDRSTYFGDGFPDEHYFLLLRDGAITTHLYFVDPAQGTEDGYSAAFAKPLEALAHEDGLSVQIAIQNCTGWWAPFVILAKPDGSHFPYPPTAGPGSERAPRVAASNRIEARTDARRGSSEARCGATRQGTLRIHPKVYAELGLDQATPNPPL